MKLMNFFFFLQLSKGGWDHERARTYKGRQPTQVGNEPSYAEIGGVPRIRVMGTQVRIPLLTTRKRSHSRLYFAKIRKI